MPRNHYDVIVIGTGVAGQTAAEELASAGLSVAAVDCREVGGTCALRGCEPKKVLVSAAEVVERAAGQCMNGVSGFAGLDWAELIAFKRTFTDPASHNIAEFMRSTGVTLLSGEARFTDADTLEIAGERYSAGDFVIATGAHPVPLDVPGDGLCLSAEQFMASETLPDRVVFIGGGYISFEFAHIAASAGAQVTIVHRSERVLRGFDPQLAEMLVRGYRARGIEVVTDAPVAEVRPCDGDYPLQVVCASGARYPAGMVMRAIGRAADLDPLALDAAGIAHSPSGIETDSSMRSTSNPRVWAAGDAAATGPQLTPVGIRQARVIVANILGEERHFDPTVIPSVAFSDPPLASVGLSEAQIAEFGLDVEVRFTDSTQWASSRRTGTRVSGTKILLERGTGRILGAHLLGHNADEFINTFAAAMLGGLTAEQIKSAMWAYPTVSSEIVYLL